MLTRRGFILAGGSAIAALSLAGPGQAAIGGAPRDALVIYSKARAPQLSARAPRHVLLTEDLAATLARFETLLNDSTAEPVTLVLDAADEVIFDIARTRVAQPRSAHLITAGKAAV